jgi:4,5-DOPA dioxygenase extradiol
LNWHWPQYGDLHMSLPTLFISHGSPLHARGGSRASAGWTALARRLPRPRAVVIASAHWETELPMVAAATQPETIHDFGGFPPDLYQLRYPAAGAPQVAQQVIDLMQQAGLAASTNACRGLDHGAWVPLRHMYPQADVPVVQVALQPGLGSAHHLRLGAALAPLANENVLIVGSGHMTHNLSEVMQLLRQGSVKFGEETPAAPYVEAFRSWIDRALRDDTLDDLSAWEERAPQACRAHPSPEHMLPLLVARGAAGPGADVERIDLGTEAQVLAMDAYVFTPAA